MYLPPQFNAKARSHALDLMRAHPLAILISVDNARIPFISHILLHLEERGEQLVLLGHCAKPKPHWKYLHAQAKDGLLKKLSAEHDPTYVQYKIKVNQHRPESHPSMHAIYAGGNVDECALTDWMLRLGLNVAASYLSGRATNMRFVPPFPTS